MARDPRDADQGEGLSARARGLIDRAALFIRRSGLRCYVLRGWPWDGAHTPKKQTLGFRCEDCGKSGGGYDDFGFDGYVSPLRTTFERASKGRGESITRTSQWEVSTWRHPR